MRRKNFLCKTTAAILSAAMVVTCTPVNGLTRVKAAGMEQAQGEFLFGSAQTKFSAGEYSLPVAMKNATDLTKESMASSCLKGATLTVNSDGSATVTLDLTAVSVMGQTAWASDWKIYQENNTTSNTVDADVTGQDAEDNVTQIKFTIPDNDADGVYVGMSAMGGQPMQAYLAFDYAAVGTSSEGTTKTGSAKVEQFGGYDVNVAVSVQNQQIAGLEVEGDNFEGTYAEANKAKLQAAADGLKESLNGKSVTDASGIEGVDAVSGATYSSNAIKAAVLNALELETSDEVINLPTEKLAEGTYQVDIAFYTDNVKHSLVENDTAKATITVDADGNMLLTTAIVNGTEKEPLYFYDFNGYYEGNDVNGTLKAAVDVKKEDIDYADDVFSEDEKVVTEVTFPLEGDFATEYTANASIYVPAMKNLTGDMGGVTFDKGRFSSDCFAKIYWDSLTRDGMDLEAGTYTLPIAMKKATDITADSMAGKCLQGAVLTVNADGSATVTIDLTGVTVGEITSWASDWKVYKEYNTTSDTVAAEVTGQDADGNVTQIQFEIPDTSKNGVYISMNSGGHVNSAYLAFDYANAEKVGMPQEAGTYTLPIAMKKATDITADSMAGKCLQGAVLTVNTDGSATVTIDLTGVTVGETTSWASEWKVYKEYNTTSDTVDAEVTGEDADGHVTQIQFAIPDTSKNGVYISMNSGGHVNSAYLAFDYANAVKQNESLEDGIYVVQGTMLKPDLTTKSMADTAFNHNIQMTVENGKAKLTMNFNGMEITGLYGYLGSLKYFDAGYQKDTNGNPKGELKEVTVESVQKYSDGVVISDSFGEDYPDVISFEVIPEALEDGLVPLQVFVPIMESITAGTGNQNVYLKLDMDSLRKTTADDALFTDTAEAPQNPAGSSGTNTTSPTPGAGSDTTSPTPDAGTNTPAPTPPSAGTGTVSPSPVPTENTEQTDTTVKVGQTVKVSGNTYKVTASKKVAFSKCKSNVKTIKVPATVKVNGVSCKVTSVAKNACKGNKKLTKVTLGKNVTTIGKNAFSGCTKLKTVVLPAGLSKKKTTAMKKQLKAAGVSSKVKVK